jgi:hypothetical protein
MNFWQTEYDYIFCSATVDRNGVAIDDRTIRIGSCTKEEPHRQRQEAGDIGMMANGGMMAEMMAESHPAFLLQ